MGDDSKKTVATIVEEIAEAGALDMLAAALESGWRPLFTLAAVDGREGFAVRAAMDGERISPESQVAFIEDLRKLLQIHFACDPDIEIAKRN